MPNAKKITKIIAQQQTPPKIKKVCAYARVSTGHEKQILSFEAQQDYYTKLLSGKPGTIFLGVYADGGISGAKADRPGFQNMMEDARNGRIDEIYTKSISRFARNALLCLQSITELRALGVRVIFEKENIDSMSGECELLLSIYAGVAEEERKQVSSNIQWSIRKKYESGISTMNPCRVYGYKKGKDGAWDEEPSQADTVRFIFRRYLDGAEPGAIADELNRAGKPTDTKSSVIWKSQRIHRIIRNEKYKGDCLLQKSFINEAGKSVPNRGELAQYYIENHHPAIVSREDWERANALADARSRKSYLFTGRLHCPRCGATMRHCYHSYGDTWQCSSYYEHGREACAGLWVKDEAIMGLTTPTHWTGHWTIIEETIDGTKEYRLIPFEVKV